jgi:hypothetical protein
MGRCGRSPGSSCFSGSRARDTTATLAYYDFAERREGSVGPVRSYDLSADGKKILVGYRNQYAIVDLKPAQKMDKRLATQNLTAVVDPREEWRQVFTDVWRTYRDVFYDESLHGLDWNAQREHYGGMLDDADRWDVNWRSAGDRRGQRVAHIREAATPRRHATGRWGCWGWTGPSRTGRTGSLGSCGAGRGTSRRGRRWPSRA